MPEALPLQLARALDELLSSAWDFGQAAPNADLAAFAATSANNIDIGVTVDSSCEAMNRGTRVVIGPTFLDRRLFAYNYKVCVFFRSPAWYRQSNIHKDSVTERWTHDGAFIEAFSQIADLFEARALVENASLLCDLSDPLGCAKALQNVLGIAIPACWFNSSNPNPLGQENSGARNDRALYPDDYRLYDYARALGGNI